MFWEPLYWFIVSGLVYMSISSRFHGHFFVSICLLLFMYICVFLHVSRNMFQVYAVAAEAIEAIRPTRHGAPPPNSDWILIYSILCRPTTCKFIYDAIIFAVTGSSHEDHILQPCSIFLLLHSIYPLLECSLGLWNASINVLLRAILSIVSSHQFSAFSTVASKEKLLD